jgi:hypothetical protein
MKNAKPLSNEKIDSVYEEVAYVNEDATVSVGSGISYEESSGMMAAKEIIVSYNAIVVDKSKSNKNLIKGLIAYSVPDEMTVGEAYDIKIRITKDSTQKKTLVIGDNEIPINDTTVNSTITIESIRVSSIMSASLSGDGEKFKITAKSSEIQNIEEFGYTEWEWNVIPLKSGENELKLIIKVRIITEDGEKSFKDIVVFEKNILTKKNISYSIQNTISKYWQWSLSTLIIPFFIWLYNRKKKKEEKEV